MLYVCHFSFRVLKLFRVQDAEKNKEQDNIFVACKTTWLLWKFSLPTDLMTIPNRPSVKFGMERDHKHSIPTYIQDTVSRIHTQIIIITMVHRTKNLCIQKVHFMSWAQKLLFIQPIWTGNFTPFQYNQCWVTNICLHGHWFAESTTSNSGCQILMTCQP